MNANSSKRKRVAIAIILLLVALMVLSSHDRLPVYATYLREKSPEITTRLTELAVTMDEAMLRQHFAGVPLSCAGQAPGNDSLGDHVCYAQIDRADGDAALMLAAFFHKGKLARLIIQTPWWSHATWMQRFNAQFGNPTQAGLVSHFGGPVLRWTMPNGYVEANRDRSFNPLTWNVIIWTGSTKAHP